MKRKKKNRNSKTKSPFQNYIKQLLFFNKFLTFYVFFLSNQKIILSNKSMFDILMLFGPSTGISALLYLNDQTIQTQNFVGFA